MKVYYRKAPGCFIYTDRYVQPWWQTLRFYLRPRPHSVRFSLPSFFRWLQRLLFPPLNDDQDDLTYDEIYAAWDVRQLEHQYRRPTPRTLLGPKGRGATPS